MVSMCGTDESAACWLNIRDPPGLVMALIAWALIIYCDFVVCYLALEHHWSLGTIIAYNVVVFLALLAHFRTMISDPGAVTADARPLDEDGVETICGRCDGFKPLNSHHCRVCGRCIVRMDHHCPWMNNCIGALNQKYFVLFLVYTLLLCGLTLGLIIGRSIHCKDSSSSSSACFPGSQAGLATSAVVLSSLSLIFAGSMLYNQVYAVNTGIGTIDRMKRRAKVHAVPIPWSDVFGHGTVFLWWLPTEPAFKSVDKVLGFRRSGDTNTSPMV